MAKVKRIDYLLDNPKKFMSNDLYNRYRSFFYQFMREHACLADYDLTVFKCCHELDNVDVTESCICCYFSDNNNSDSCSCAVRMDKFLDEEIEL